MQYGDPFWAFRGVMLALVVLFVVSIVALFVPIGPQWLTGSLAGLILTILLAMVTVVVPRNLRRLGGRE